MVALNKFRILLMLRISVYALFLLVEIETLLYLWNGYQLGLMSHSHTVYVSPLVLIIPWLIWRRITAVVTLNSAALKTISSANDALLILSSSAAIAAYASVAIVMTGSSYVMHFPK
jgi:hypothetical protein